MIPDLSCHYLASGMLKREDSFNLTNIIFTKTCSVQEELREVYNLALPYFLTISPTIYQIKSLSLHFFLILKISIPIFY